MSYTITVSASPARGGTVNISGTTDAQGKYIEGTTVTISATPAQGYKFDAWVNEAAVFSVESTLQFTANSDLDLAAYFSLISYNNLTLIADTGGSTTGGGSYPTGSTVTAEAQPDANYRFVKWMKDGVDYSTDNPLELTLIEDTTLSAVFEYIQYTVTIVNNNPNMTVSGAGTFNSGSSITIQASGSGARFVSWTIDSQTIIDNPYTFTLTGNITATLNSINLYSVTVHSSNDNIGSVTGGGTFDAGSQITIQATAISPAVFSRWVYADTLMQFSTRASITVTVDKDYSLIAIFENQVYYTVEATSANEDYGTVTGGGQYVEGEVVTLRATPNEGYDFYGWSVDSVTDLISENPYQFVVSTNMRVVGYFGVPIITYSIKTFASPTIGGTTTPTLDYVNAGTSRVIKATPNTGYIFYAWEESNDEGVTWFGTQYKQNDTVVLASSNRWFRAIFKPTTAPEDIITLDSDQVEVADDLEITMNDPIVTSTYKFYWSQNSTLTDKVLWANVTNAPSTFALTVGNEFEAAMLYSNSKEFYLYVEAYDQDNYLYATQTAPFTVSVPQSFWPLVMINEVANYQDTQFQGKSLAGITTYERGYSVRLPAPEGYVNHATINQKTITVTRGNYTYTDSLVSGTFGTYYTDYTFNIQITVTDSRGNTVTVNSPSETVYGYYRPEYKLVSLTRCKEDGTTSEDPEENKWCKLTYKLDMAKVGNANTIIPETIVTKIQGFEESYPTTYNASSDTYECVLGGELFSDVNYVITIEYYDSVMVALDMERPILIKQSLVERVPISLYDSFEHVGAALGVEATRPDRVELGLDTIFGTDKLLHASEYIADAQEINSVSKSAFSVIDRGGQNSVAVSDEDLNSGNYANDIHIISSQDYMTAKNANKLDDHTFYVLLEITNLQ